MKKILFLSVFALLLYSCEEEVVKKEATVISGKLDNFKKRSLTLKGADYEKKVSFDRKSGSFRDTLTDIKEGHYALFAGKRRISMYITDGSKINITADIKDRTENPKFTGNNAKINKYLAERSKQFGLIAGSANKLFALKEGEFLSTVDKFKSKIGDLVKSYQLPEDYAKKELNNTHYEFTRYLDNYEDYYRLLSGDENFKVSSNFPKNIIDDINFNTADDYTFSVQYRALLTQLLEKKANDRKSESDYFDLTLLETINSKVSDTLIKNDLLYNTAKSGQSSITYTTNLKEYYNKFMSYSTNPNKKKEITAIYDKLKLTARGQDSPKFENYKNYKGGTTSLDDLIGKGKYLYIDVWATWCGFCKKEIPLLKRFEQQYHDKNIEFVSISVDTKDKFDKWKQTIEDKEMGGVQLFGGNKESELQFTKDYLIKGLPRFILIDPNGKIVSANAPRPSNGTKLEEIFDALDI